MKKQFLHLFVFIVCLWPAASNAQNVGIGTNNPTAKFHTIGSVKFDTLSGIGVRPVMVDPAGNIFASVPALPASTITNSTGTAIPDFSCGGASSNIVLSQLPSPVSSAKIKVTVNITHPRPADLTIYLIAPNGNILNLFATSNTTGSNLISTSFTDAGDALSTSAPPFTGVFSPKGDISPNICTTPTVPTFAAIGGGTINPNGTWTLKVIDNTSVNTGTLNNWTLSVDPGIGLSGLWNLNGNAGTNQDNFIGTTDATPLRFRVNNHNSGIIDSAKNNTSIGFKSMDSIINGTDNTVFGAGSFLRNKNGIGNSGFGATVLRNQVSGTGNTAMGNGAIGFGTLTGSFNTAVGYAALLNVRDGANNIAIGANSMGGAQHSASNTAVGISSLYNGGGYSNVAIGSNTLFNNFDRNNLVAVGDSALYNNGIGAVNAIDAVQNTAIGSKALYANTIGNNNTAVGYQALQNNTSGSDNSAFGALALKTNNTGSNNTAIGWASLTNNSSGFGNTATGFYAQLSNTTGFYNTATGNQALYNNTTGAQNVAMGRNALVNNTSGGSNVAIGFESLFSNTDRTGMVAIGTDALYSNGTGASNINDATANTAVGSFAMFQNSTGYRNVAVGYEAMHSNTNSFGNTAVGYYSLNSNTGVGSNYNTAVGFTSLENNTSGFGNVAMGAQAMELGTSATFSTGVGMLALRNYSGNYNTAIGYSADVSTSSLSNATAIGANSVATASNMIQLGNSSVTNVNTYGNMTVLNGKGLIRSSDGTQQKKVVTTISISTSIAALSTFGAAISFSESFSAPPDVFVGNVTGGGGFAEVIMTVANVSATGFSFFVSNPRTSTYSPNFSVKIIAIGPQ